MSRLERTARAIAFGYAATYVVVGGPLGPGSHTVAEMAGYGQWGDSPSRWAEAHWTEFKLAAELAQAVLIGMRTHE